jgi:hypothetical protein
MAACLTGVGEFNAGMSAWIALIITALLGCLLAALDRRVSPFHLSTTLCPSDSEHAGRYPKPLPGVLGQSWLGDGKFCEPTLLFQPSGLRGWSLANWQGSNSVLKKRSKRLF